MCCNYYDNKIISLIEATIIIIVNETTVQISAVWQVSLSLLIEYNAVSNYIGPSRGEKIETVITLIVIAIIVEMRFVFRRVIVVAIL